jgi:hypothetical protein
MVFCRECKKKVEDCQHFVAPLDVPAIPVFDPKIKTLAYKPDTRILEIAFKNGQVWQLAGVQPDIYEALLQQTLSSFLKLHQSDLSPSDPHSSDWRALSLNMINQPASKPLLSSSHAGCPLRSEPLGVLIQA